MSKKLQAKKALVTGASRGIGFAIAERLRDEGAEVIATGTKPDGQGPAGCSYEAVDFSDTQQTQEFADKLKDWGVDILINNAGINKISPFAKIDPADFARIQQVNVTAPFLLCRAVLPMMSQKKWGRIVNISSIWGKISKEYRGPYSASKFAIDGMTAALAAEVGEVGILANSIAPGFIDTELTRQVLGDDGCKELAQQVPLKRLGQPKEIAEFVCFLTSPQNTYITGQNIAIDGGFTRV